jgi:hypothetical protein
MSSVPMTVFFLSSDSHFRAPFSRVSQLLDLTFLQILPTCKFMKLMVDDLLITMIMVQIRFQTTSFSIVQPPFKDWLKVPRKPKRFVEIDVRLTLKHYIGL